MPDIGGTIRTHVLADAGISATIGTRMYSDFLPQGSALPAITYQVVDTLPNETLSGIADVSRARLQIDSYATTRASANLLADAVRLVLEKYRGVVSGQFINEINLATGEVYAIDRPASGSDERRFITTLDFYVFYRTTTS